MAFVPARNIADNIILASKISRHLYKRRRGTNRLMSLKLNISKVYDLIEWNYLRGILAKLGFSSKWIDPLMVCVSWVSYSYIINGRPRGYLYPSHGLR